ncbi:MAG: threonine-phosphate decarboxylase [Negativicoccus succinicivorans]|nr:threonine-phosphate decarboxylase [Negativicoccus succinicivorans]
MSADLDALYTSFQHGGNIYALPPSVREQVEDFSANINPLGLSPEGVEALQDWPTLALHYPEPNNSTLRKAVARFYQYDEAGVVLGNGATELLFTVFRYWRPATVWIPVPTFSEYSRAAIAVGAEIRQIAWEDLPNSLTQMNKGDVLCICSPNNPTGVYTDVSQLKQWLQAARTRGARVLVDESFIDFNPNLDTARSLLGKCDDFVVLHSLTKFWGIPGLRAGVMFAAPQLAETVYADLDIWNVNALTASYLKAAFNDIEYFQNTQRFVYEEKERVYENYVALSEFFVYPPTANFILLNLQGKITAAELTERLLAKGLMIRNCDNYHGLDAYHVRIAIRQAAANDRLFTAISKEVSRSR